MAAPLRFTDILTNAAAIANLLGRDTVTARQLAQAVQLLRNEIAVEDLGRAVSPLARAAIGGPQVSPELQALVQRWYGELGFAPMATLDGEPLARFLRDAEALESDSDSSSKAEGATES